MSLKRIAGITIFGILFIGAVIGAMLLTSYLRRDDAAIPLPVPQPTISETPVETDPEVPDRVEVTAETIQQVVSTLKRPSTYSRGIYVCTYWAGGQAEYTIDVSVHDDLSSLWIMRPMGEDKRVIITEDMLYIWYSGDKTPYASDELAADGVYKDVDEWQMIITYEDLLSISRDDIVEAGYVEYGGEDCIYAMCRSRTTGYMRVFYVSLDVGLVTGAEEYDEYGDLVYSMASGDCSIGAIDPTAFTLPDGTDLLPG
ncbi:MAG: hypothetical protein FWH33_09955 [Oscillospiraceae bacterium]|nr:hypothetical protein [Oscillospiraceae bacterium]